MRSKQPSGAMAGAYGDGMASGPWAAMPRLSEAWPGAFWWGAPAFGTDEGAPLVGMVALATASSEDARYAGGGGDPKEGRFDEAWQLTLSRPRASSIAISPRGIPALALLGAVSGFIGVCVPLWT